VVVNLNILELVDAELMHKNSKDGRDNTHFHPSEFHGCHRKIAYKYHLAKGVLKLTNLNATVDAKGVRIFDVGHSAHDRWKEYLTHTKLLRGYWRCLNFIAHEKPRIYGIEEKLGVEKPGKCECGCTEFIYEEVGFYDEETLLGGHVDAILFVPKYNEHIVVDFKTINPEAYKFLRGPHDSHITQMQIYLFLSGVSAGKFIYECKGTQQVKEYLVLRDDDFIEEKRQEAEEIME